MRSKLHTTSKVEFKNLKHRLSQLLKIHKNTLTLTENFKFRALQKYPRAATDHGRKLDHDLFKNDHDGNFDHDP